MRVAKLLVGLAVSAAIYTVGVAWFGRLPRWLDPFLILTLYISLERERPWSTISGSATGLAFDALSGSLYGLHGFANTVVGYAAATVQQRFVIQGPFLVGLLFVVGAAVQQAVVAALQFLLVRGDEMPDPVGMLLTMAATGLLGTLLYLGTARFLDWEQHWREQRRRRLTIDTR